MYVCIYIYIYIPSPLQDAPGFFHETHCSEEYLTFASTFPFLGTQALKTPILLRSLQPLKLFQSNNYSHDPGGRSVWNPIVQPEILSCTTGDV